MTSHFASIRGVLKHDLRRESSTETESRGMEALSTLRERRSLYLTDQNNNKLMVALFKLNLGSESRPTCGSDTYWSRRRAYNSSIFCSLVRSSANMLES